MCVTFQVFILLTSLATLMENTLWPSPTRVCSFHGGGTDGTWRVTWLAQQVRCHVNKLTFDAWLLLWWLSGRLPSDTADCATPKLVDKLQDVFVSRVWCGSKFSVALSRTGSVYTWGCGMYCCHGHPTQDTIRSPTLLETLQGFTLVFAALTLPSRISVHPSLQQQTRKFYNLEVYAYFLVIWKNVTSVLSVIYEALTGKMLSYFDLPRSATVLNRAAIYLFRFEMSIFISQLLFKNSEILSHG